MNGDQVQLISFVENYPYVAQAPHELIWFCVEFAC
jgi:hypothetical protein